MSRYSVKKKKEPKKKYSLSEELSVYMDGEKKALSHMSCFDDFSKEQLSEKWLCYHMIRSVLREELPSHLPTSFSDKVRAALDHLEPPMRDLEYQALATPPNRFQRYRLWCLLTSLVLGAALLLVL